jgi:hypothetical protein
MDVSPLHPMLSDFEADPAAAEDYYSDDNDVINIRGYHDVFTKQSNFPNMEASNVANPKDTIDSSLRSDFGYSSFSARTVSSADSSSMFDSVTSSTVPSNYPKASSYQFSPGTRQAASVLRSPSLSSVSVANQAADEYNNDDVRLRVDGSAPLSLSLGGDMEWKVGHWNLSPSEAVRPILL